jgi:flagellar protein FlaI
MEILERYGNRKIVLEDGNLPRYIIEPYPFLPDEKKLLENSEKFFTQDELESVRKEPNIDTRKKALFEYLNLKIPDSKNKELLISSMVNRVTGYGPLSDLIGDPNLEEIMVNGINLPVFVFHKKCGMCSTDIRFNDKNEIFRVINRLCWVHGKEVAPIIDLSTIDGSRVNVTMEPITIHGATLTIRKQKRQFFTITELLLGGTLNIDLAALLWLATDGMRMCPANMLISGMIGSGKTTLLNALTMLTPPDERIITIEDTPELQLSGKENWVPLIAQKEYDMESLVRNTLRMRPNRIVVGEIRGTEAMSLFSAMNVGHKGIGTIHASSPRETIFRLENPPMSIPTSLIANLDLIVVMNIFNIGGRPVRRVTEVADIGGHEGGVVLLGTIYQWDPVKDRAVESDMVAPTAYLDKLADRIRVSKREILNELDKRKGILIDLANRRVFSQTEVMAAVNAFYRTESNLEIDVAKEISKPVKGRGKG